MTGFSAAGSGRAGVGLVVVRGQLDGDADAPLTEAWVEATAGGPRAVVLDVSAVSYINSTGIAVLVGLLARARGEGRELRVCGLSDHYRHIFEITRLIDLVSIYDTSEQAAEGPVALG